MRQNLGSPGVKEGVCYSLPPGIFLVSERPASLGISPLNGPWLPAEASGCSGGHAGSYLPTRSVDV